MMDDFNPSFLRRSSHCCSVSISCDAVRGREGQGLQRGPGLVPASYRSKSHVSAEALCTAYNAVPICRPMIQCQLRA
jgi:hypothetical protein